MPQHTGTPLLHAAHVEGASFKEVSVDVTSRRSMAPITRGIAACQKKKESTC